MPPPRWSSTKAATTWQRHENRYSSQMPAKQSGGFSRRVCLKQILNFAGHHTEQDRPTAFSLSLSTMPVCDARSISGDGGLPRWRQRDLYLLSRLLLRPQSQFKARQRIRRVHRFGDQFITDRWRPTERLYLWLAAANEAPGGSMQGRPATLAVHSLRHTFHIIRWKGLR